MMSIFLMNLSHKKGWFKRDNLIPTSCKAVLIKLNRRIPANWSTKCNKNNLTVNIQYPENKKKPLSDKHLRKILFRELANALKSIAVSSPQDNLERVHFLIVNFYHSKLTIKSLIEGKHAARLATMNHPRLIAEHLKATVSVQEIPKK